MNKDFQNRCRRPDEAIRKHQPHRCGKILQADSVQLPTASQTLWNWPAASASRKSVQNALSQKPATTHQSKMYAMIDCSFLSSRCHHEVHHIPDIDGKQKSAGNAANAAFRLFQPEPKREKQQRKECHHRKVAQKYH